MWRDIDPRPQERERPDLSRGTGSGDDRSESASNDPRDVFSRDLDLPRGTPGGRFETVIAQSISVNRKSECSPR
jgi:hypothetical protein